MDTFFVVMAILDVVFIAGMVWTAIRMLETAKSGATKVEPAIREVKALTETGKALAFHIRDDGKEMAQRVTTVAQIVKRRVATTRQIISEIKPRSAETAEAVRDAASSVRETSADLGNRARTVGDLAQRLSRVKTAAQAAVRAGATKP
jgi:methyl-accepting chemotaxis protein